MVNPDSGMVEWPGEVDLNPEVLYGRYEPASEHRIEPRTVRAPATITKSPHDSPMARCSLAGESEHVRTGSMMNRRQRVTLAPLGRRDLNPRARDPAGCVGAGHGTVARSGHVAQPTET